MQPSMGLMIQPFMIDMQPLIQLPLILYGSISSSSFAVLFASGGFMAFAFFFGTLVAIILKGFNEPLLIVYEYILLYILFFYLLDLAVFYIRMAAGRIQGAIIFDPQEKKIYAFPSVNSNYYLGGYKEYHESELIHTSEHYYGWGSGSFYYYANVFFTKEKNEYAFKVDDLKGNNFGEILSHQEPEDISIPFKHRFHSIILFLVSIIMASQSAYWIFHSLPKAP